MKNQNFVGVKYDNFTSFLISLLIYFGAAFLLLFNAIKDHELALKYTDDPNAYMDIIVDWEIDDSAPKAPDLAKEVPAQPQVEEKPKEIEKIEEPKPEPLPEPKPVEEPKPEPKPNLNDLFADTTKDNKKLQESTEKKEEKQESGSKNAVQKDDKKSGKSQMTGQFNAYIGQINKILQQIWTSYNPKSNEVAKIGLKIDNNGRVVECKILELTYDTEFNQKLRDFASGLESREFPKPPQNEVLNATLNIKPLK